MPIIDKMILHLERIINTPTRGIGDQTLIAIRETAKMNQCSLWQAIEHMITEKTLNNRAISALAAFKQLIEDMSNVIQPLSNLAEQVEHVLQLSGLMMHYQQEKGEKAQAKVENLEELINAASQFIPENSELTPLQAFLSHAALEAGETQDQLSSNCVQLMTLHTAKGLEFKIVFICGLEEGLFPHELSIRDEKRLEEERRLCYVGITRAREKLYLSHAECRRFHGKENFQRPSRFLGEIPKKYLEEIRPKARLAALSHKHFTPQHHPKLFTMG